MDADEPGPVPETPEAAAAPEQDAAPAPPEEAAEPATPEQGAAPAFLEEAAEPTTPEQDAAPAFLEEAAEPTTPEGDAAPAVVSGPPPPELVELTLASVELSPEGLQPATGTVTLVDLAGGGHLDIVMARADAVLVQEALAGTPAPRPRAHDLLLAAVAALSGAVTAVTLVERRPGGVYVASVRVLRPEGSLAELDARPSDALNVALRAAGAGLWAHRSLVEIPAN